MSQIAAPVAHVRLDETGRPWIVGTTMKMVELVTGVVAYGWNAEDLEREYPHLTPGQIHGALAYYYDNQSMLDAEIVRISEAAAREAEKSADSPLRRRLRSLGKLVAPNGRA